MKKCRRYIRIVTCVNVSPNGIEIIERRHTLSPDTGNLYIPIDLNN